MKLLIDSMAARKKKLYQFWDETLGYYVKLYSKSKNRGQKATARKLQSIQTEVKEYVLDVYFRKCRAKYVQAFGDWRQQYLSNNAVHLL